MKKREKGVVKKAAKAAALSHFEKYLHAVTKWDKGFWMTVIFDFAYLITMVGVIFLLAVVFNNVLIPLAVALQSLMGIFAVSGPTGELTPALEASLNQSVSSLAWFLIKMTLLLIGALVLFFGITALYKAYIWLHLTKQKYTWGYVKKFVAMSILWQFAWLAVAAGIFFVFTVNVAAALLGIELAAYLYFTPFYRCLLTEKHTLKRLWKETFVIGVKKFPHFIIPCVLMLITIVFSMWAAVLLIDLVAPFAMGILGILFIFVTFSWVRFYFYLIAKHVTGA